MCVYWVALLMHSSDEMTENGPNHMVLLDIKLKCQGILKSEVVKSQATVKQISFFFIWSWLQPAKNQMILLLLIVPPLLHNYFFQMITLAFDWGQKLMKTRMTTWMPTLWMDSANLGLTLPLRVPFKELFLLFGKWFGSRILRLLSWSPISLKMERYVVKKNLLEICLNIVEKQPSLLI